LEQLLLLLLLLLLLVLLLLLLPLLLPLLLLRRVASHNTLWAHFKCPRCCRSLLLKERLVNLDSFEPQKAHQACQ
jgi:hypothetical protein